MKKVRSKLVASIILMAANSAAMAADNTVLLIIEAFSGRENPSIEINLNDQDALSKSIKSLVTSSNANALKVKATQDFPNGLGYRGVTVLDPAGKLIAKGAMLKINSDVIAVAGSDSASVFENTHMDLEQQVMERALNTGKIDAATFARLGTGDKRRANSAPKLSATLLCGEVAVTQQVSIAGGSTAAIPALSTTAEPVTWAEAETLLHALESQPDILSSQDATVFNQSMIDVSRVVNGLNTSDRKKFVARMNVFVSSKM